MPTDTPIRILEKDSNKRGDLFNRLIGNLFLALGYSKQVRCNIQKPGREVDLAIIHSTEPKLAIAECKAMKTKIGGDVVNKFGGSLRPERKQNPEMQIVGYYVSLSGFKETAIEQEKVAGDEGVILLNGNQVVEVLIAGSILETKEKAMEKAGRCAAGQSRDLKPEGDCELLAHDLGWIWAVYYMQNKKRTHFALIHADGDFIDPEKAKLIIKSDKSIGGDLHTLKYLPPPKETAISEGQIKKARDKYFEYLKAECGEITLEGLPADQEVGARRMELENLFVPLYLEQCREHKKRAPLYWKEDENDIFEWRNPTLKRETSEREPVGKVLAEHSRLAILADPGGGKTTLLKRLAVAYAFPERRKQTDDNLPEKNWLPLFIRCRQLGVLANEPISKILGSIPQRAEMSELADAFELLVKDALHKDNALLLVDGLDEITDEGERVAFVNQLRIFLAIYNKVNVVVTSREAGFRIVGGALSAHCDHFRIADFDDNDIKRLTLAWHKVVIGEREKVRVEANELAQRICNADRVRQLAKNPLLLTTLLLVKRWVRRLPTRRSVLYGKAIEVLLMTWNVEGHEPIDQDEAIPQLAFVAFTMMKEGLQTISVRRLEEILYLSREQMQAELGFAEISVPEFVKRIESRSSLMILSGHDIEEGTLYPIYEFRHLTFQEYLTGRAIVEGYYPNRKDDDTILTVLEPYLENEQWKEVIPLAAVLAGRKAQSFFKFLIEYSKKKLTDDQFNIYPRGFLRELPENYLVDLLGRCILDEVQIEPLLLEDGLKLIVKRTTGSTLIPLLYRGKFGRILEEIVQKEYIKTETEFFRVGSALAYTTSEDIKCKRLEDISPQVLSEINLLLEDRTSIQKAKGALAIVAVTSTLTPPLDPEIELVERLRKPLEALGEKLTPLLYSEQPFLFFSACWAFACLGKTSSRSPKKNPKVLTRLLDIWFRSQVSDIKYAAAWAITELPIIDRELKPLPKPTTDLIKFIRSQYWAHHNIGFGPKNIQASLVIGYYWGQPWPDREIARLLVSRYYSDSRHTREFLKALGEPGKEIFARYKNARIKETRETSRRGSCWLE